MIVEVCVLFIVLSRTPEVCEAGERVFHVDSAQVKSSNEAVTITALGLEPDVCFGTHLEDALAADLSQVHEVRHVLVEKAENNLLVWIALDNPIREVRERVFRKELELIEGFPEIEFDFNVIQAKDSDPRQFASSAKIIYSREDADVAKQG
jgi:hypothetical protein